jgi:RNA polymerase sigma-70 factor (family 1)
MFIKDNHKADDTILVSKLSAGCTDAFDALYDKYWIEVYTSAFKRLQDSDLSKDVTQDVFLQLWEKRTSLQIENLPSYLYVAVRNKVYNLTKKEKRHVAIQKLFADLTFHCDQADAEVIKKEFLNAYQAVFDQLTPKQKKVFELRYTDDLSSDAIAERLNISKKTVQNHLSTAVTRLRSAVTTVSILIVIASNR